MGRIFTLFIITTDRKLPYYTTSIDHTVHRRATVLIRMSELKSFPVKIHVQEPFLRSKNRKHHVHFHTFLSHINKFESYKRYPLSAEPDISREVHEHAWFCKAT